MSSYIPSSAASINSSSVTDRPAGSAERPIESESRKSRPGRALWSAVGPPEPIHRALGIELRVSHQEHAELVAADAPREVRYADGFAEHVGRLLQQHVAHRMAELVVHLLETVHVDEQEGDGRSGSSRDQELVLAEREEAAPVGELREFVDRGEPTELLLELGEVRSGPDQRPGERPELVLRGVRLVERPSLVESLRVVPDLADPSHDARGEADHEDHRRDDGRRHRDDLDQEGTPEGGVSRRDLLGNQLIGRQPHLLGQPSQRVGDRLPVEEQSHEPIVRRASPWSRHEGWP